MTLLVFEFVFVQRRSVFTKQRRIKLGVELSFDGVQLPVTRNYLKSTIESRRFVRVEYGRNDFLSRSLVKEDVETGQLPFPLVLIDVDADTGRHVALLVDVNRTDRIAKFRKCGGQIDRCRRFFRTHLCG